jgi:hypothetical protein
MLTASAYADDSISDEPLDPGVSRLMALGIEDEPTIRIGCSKEQEAIRLVDYVQSRIRALVRVQKRPAGIEYTFRQFDGGNESESEIQLLDMSDWTSLIDGLEEDSFWIKPSTVTTWRPDGLRWMLEACLSGHYRMHTLDPDFEFKMNDLVEKLVGLKEATKGGATP